MSEPTPPELRAYLAQHGLTPADAAKLLQVTYRAVAYWCQDESTRHIPHAHWFALRAKVEGRVPDDQ